MVALSQPCKKLPIVAAIATNAAPFIFMQWSKISDLLDYSAIEMNLKLMKRIINNSNV